MRARSGRSASKERKECAGGCSPTNEWNTGKGKREKMVRKKAKIGEHDFLQPYGWQLYGRNGGSAQERSLERRIKQWDLGWCRVYRYVYVYGLGRE